MRVPTHAGWFVALQAFNSYKCMISFSTTYMKRFRAALLSVAECPMLCILLLLMIDALAAVAQIEAPTEQCRMIVLTDIGNEPDDSQTMCRLMLYSNEIDIEGLIATTSVHRSGEVNPQMISRIVEAYGKVRPNLLLHKTDFPAAESLLKLIKSGSTEYGMKGVGKGMDTEGSEWIIRCIDKDDARPLWITVWGGANTLAQALWKLKNTREKVEVERAIGRLRVYSISDQDDAGWWIRKTFPNCSTSTVPVPTTMPHGTLGRTACPRRPPT